MKYLTSAMDCLPNEFNPNLFVSCKAAYLDELKKCYTKHRKSEYQLFLAFGRGEYINLEHLPKITNYICCHLISWSPNRSCFESRYSYISKLTIVCHWKQKRSLPTCS